MNGPVPDPRTAARRFVTLTFLFWLPVGLSVPVLVLLPTERGMSLAAVAGLFAVHALTVAALELPTGGLADVLGRRSVLAAAGVCHLTALVLLGLATTVGTFTLAMVLLGSGRALSSGPAEAWYVDTVQAHSGPGAPLRTGLARAGTATAAALALGTLAGGGLPWLLSHWPDAGVWLRAAGSGTVLPLSVPLLLGAVVELFFVGYVMTSLPEPPRTRTTLREVLRTVPVTVLGGLGLGVRDALVRRTLLTSGTLGAALATTELLTPGRAADLTGARESGAVVFASLACTGYLCTALGSHGGPWLARLTGSAERAVPVSLGVATAGLLTLGLTVPGTGTGALVLAGLGYALLHLGIGSAGPNGNELLHHRVDGSRRATALSVQSLALQAAGALTGLAAGALPPGPLPWLLGGTVLLLGTLLWIRRGEQTPSSQVVTVSQAHPRDRCTTSVPVTQASGAGPGMGTALQPSRPGPSRQADGTPSP
ncbi:MFS transporter [Streptomyces sp. NPDC002055]|uniref:MFS transporter n=1 Tax=Streptomyces sp. NPDC002055 TaxID=3154534 RepID=UPI0033293913